jgi:hypothetical protein
MANSINFSFDDKLAKPVDELPTSYEHKSSDVSHPPQTADGDEYLCGNSGPEHSYANAGRDQDRSRADERIAAQGCARYVS